MGHDQRCGPPHRRRVVRPRVLPQHLDLRYRPDALPARPEGPGARRPRRHHGVAQLLRARDRPDFGVVRGAAQPRGHPPAPLVAPRGALPPMRGEPDRRALARRVAERLTRLRVPTLHQKVKTCTAESSSAVMTASAASTNVTISTAVTAGLADLLRRP